MFDESPTQKLRALRAAQTLREEPTELLLVAPEHLSALVRAVRDAASAVQRVEARMSALERTVQERLSHDAVLVRAAKTLGLVAAGAVVEAVTSGRMGAAAMELLKVFGG